VTTIPVAAVYDRRKTNWSAVAAVYDRRLVNDFDAHRAPLQNSRYKTPAVLDSRYK